jgi:hypothetical protein
MARRKGKAGEHGLVEALVALAARQGLGEPIDWRDVESAVAALLDDPVAKRDLRALMVRLNDAEVARTLEDWFLRAADARDADAGDANRAGEKLLAPLQVVGLGGFATSGIALAAGTLAGTVGLPILAAAGVVAGAATWGRWRLSKREDDARADARAIRDFAAIARTRVER